jgi:hypothetical protein
MSEIPPPPVGGRWNDWGERINSYLVRNLYRLPFLRGGESAADNGIIAWDAAEDHAVVTRTGSFEPLSYGHNSHLLAYTTTTFTATAADTETLITWTNEALSNHISIDDTTTSRIVFEKAGTYKLEFSCELASGNSNSKTIYIWPKKNGSSLSYSTMVHSVKNSGDRKVITRAGLFTVAANDYIEAAFSVSDTGLTIDGTAASSPYPASPSATMVITQVNV